MPAGVARSKVTLSARRSFEFRLLEFALLLEEGSFSASLYSLFPRSGSTLWPGWLDSQALPHAGHSTSTSSWNNAWPWVSSTSLAVAHAQHHAQHVQNRLRLPVLEKSGVKAKLESAVAGMRPIV